MRNLLISLTLILTLLITCSTDAFSQRIGIVEIFPVTGSVNVTLAGNDSGGKRVSATDNNNSITISIVRGAQRDVLHTYEVPYTSNRIEFTIPSTDYSGLESGNYTLAVKLDEVSMDQIEFQLE